MIKKVLFKDIMDCPIKWTNGVKYLKENKEINFTEGINLIIGPNGSGKSTILNNMATALHCIQSNKSTITRTSVMDMLNEEDILNRQVFKGLELEHDGQIAYYFANKQIGLSDKGASFDDDFFSEGISTILNEKISSGEKNMYRFVNFLESLNHTELEEKVSQHNFSERNGINYFIEATRLIKNPNIEKGKQTILLDEPDLHLDIFKQIHLCKVLLKLGSKYQLIISLHNPFMFKFINQCNIIELEEDYCEKTKRATEKWVLDN